MGSSPYPRGMADDVFTITTAATSLRDDQRARQRAYLLSMAVRTACFLGAIVAPNPWRWILIGGAVVLPYFAVVVANGGRSRGLAASIVDVDRRSLDSH
jgi:predicted tellurium resistance membrane protein TerC